MFFKRYNTHTFLNVIKTVELRTNRLNPYNLLYDLHPNSLSCPISLRKSTPLNSGSKMNRKAWEINKMCEGVKGIKAMQGLMGKCQWLSASQAKFLPPHKGLRDTTHSQSLVNPLALSL